MQETELDPDDLILIEALAAGQTHQQAAEHAGCSSKTVQRRLRDPAFTHALRERHAERLDQLATGLEASATIALEALNELMQSENEQIRMSAVRLALSEHVKYRSTHEHEARLLELEASTVKPNAT